MNNSNQKITCLACMHRCSLNPGQKGICGARIHRDGKILPENYGRLTAIALDPIEKKPLCQFYPGSMILSVGSYGCNLKCPFCQNHEISMDYSEYTRISYVSPPMLADAALQCQVKGNIGVAYTYNEPLIGWEYVRDTAKLVKERGMKNVLVTNGTASMEVLEELLVFIDAMNIDLKGFREDYYQKLGGNLETVKAFIARAAKGCHVEITTLIVPGENDSEWEMEEEAKWIASIGKEIPLHVTRFFPRYQMKDKEATNIGQVYRLADAARKYLGHVLTGNC